MKFLNLTTTAAGSVTLKRQRFYMSIWRYLATYEELLRN
ncbi:hypothetical protein DSBG_0272 [Desulfosporosinus sp. BG]|nr:hypothetical protein DSBG_0272 [Desulfosporosinus sp. BG]